MLKPKSGEAALWERACGPNGFGEGWERLRLQANSHSGQRHPWKHSVPFRVCLHFTVAGQSPAGRLLPREGTTPFIFSWCVKPDAFAKYRRVEMPQGISATETTAETGLRLFPPYGALATEQTPLFEICQEPFSVTSVENSAFSLFAWGMLRGACCGRRAATKKARHKGGQLSLASRKSRPG